VNDILKRITMAPQNEGKDNWDSSVSPNYECGPCQYTSKANCLTRVQEYQHSGSFVPKLAGKVVEWLDLQKDDVVLDIGCGG